MFVPNKIINNNKYYMSTIKNIKYFIWTLNKKMSFGLNQINGYLRRGLHLERFDPSQGLMLYGLSGIFMPMFKSKHMQCYIFSIIAPYNMVSTLCNINDNNQIAIELLGEMEIKS